MNLLQVMNFHFLFSLLSAHTFVVEFPVHVGDRQDYFFFEGENQTAHLYRNNHTLGLFLSRGSSYSRYYTEINQDNFTFSWDEFSVDEVKMNLSDTVGSVDDLQFENFTFLSPVTKVSLNEGETECVHQLNSVNYWYILLIVLLVGALFDSKTHGLEMAKKIAAMMRPNISFGPVSARSEREIAV